MSQKNRTRHSPPFKANVALAAARAGIGRYFDFHNNPSARGARSPGPGPLLRQPPENSRLIMHNWIALGTSLECVEHHPTAVTGGGPVGAEAAVGRRDVESIGHCFDDPPPYRQRRRPWRV